MLRQASSDQRRIAHRDRAEDDAGEPLARSQFSIWTMRSDAAAERTGFFVAFEDGVDSRAVDGLAGKGAVEIDHVQPFEALVLEGFGLGGRIGIVDGVACCISPQLQAHALAVLRGLMARKEDHCVFSVLSPASPRRSRKL